MEESQILGKDTNVLKLCDRTGLEPFRNEKNIALTEFFRHGRRNSADVFRKKLFNLSRSPLYFPIKASTSAISDTFEFLGFQSYLQTGLRRKNKTSFCYSVHELSSWMVGRPISHSQGWPQLRQGFWKKMIIKIRHIITTPKLLKTFF